MYIGGRRRAAALLSVAIAALIYRTRAVSDQQISNVSPLLLARAGRIAFMSVGLEETLGE